MPVVDMPTAVEGAFSLPFGLGVAYYDQPPPDELPDVEALLSADAIRFANQLHAWIEVEDGQVTGHGMSGSGRLGSTTVRLGSHGLTFAGVAPPGLTPPPEVHRDRVVHSGDADVSVRDLEERYGREELWKPIDDAWENGWISGKLSALRWVLGSEWDFLGTLHERHPPWQDQW